MIRQNIIDDDLDKEIYRSNRKDMIDIFDNDLKEAKQGSEMAIVSAIRAIKNQEKYIDHISKNKRKYAIPKEEKQVLNGMIKKAKTTFGEDYSKWYEIYCNENRK